MNGLFYDTAFNYDLSAWDTSQVVSMDGMFRLTDYFNQDISMWDVSKVTRFSATFFQAAVFNQNLSPWDVSSATTVGNMFGFAASFTQTLCWDLSGVTAGDIDTMFSGTGSGGSVIEDGSGVCEPTDAPSASPSETSSASPSASPVAGAPCDDASDCPAGSSCDMDVLNGRRRRMQTRGGTESRRRLFFDSPKKQGKCTA
jgi:hypothetical protein